MKLKNIFSAVLVGTALLSIGCSRDKFAEINVNPASVTKPNLPFMFTQAQMDTKPSDYLLWFYAQGYTTNWCQSFVPSAGYQENFNTMQENGGVGSQYVSVLRYKREINNFMSTMADDDAARYQNMQAMISPMVVYLGIFDSDMFGDKQYTEACKAKFGGTLTPDYDTQKDLYDVWLGELDASIATLTSNLDNQISLGNKDLYWQGKAEKWAKFANSLKLAIAARLINADRTKALAIAKEVVDSPAGIMESADDNLLVNKGSKDYGWGNNGGKGKPNKDVVDFMIKNHDPRVRFFFTKNSLNAEVVQAFFDAQAEGVDCVLPDYILAKMNTHVEGGKTIFDGYKDGDKWSRFVGIPSDFEAKQIPEYNGGANNYFASNKFQVKLGDKTKTYGVTSNFNEEYIHGWLDYTYSTKPGGEVYKDIVDQPFSKLYFSTAEVMLYLAEFKLYGADLPKTAQEYLTAGVRASIEEHNNLAKINRIPFSVEEDYFAGLGEETILLEDGEIDTALAADDCVLTGDKALDLEKVFIQQYLHFMYRPIDQITTSRLGGIPKVGSTMIPWATGIEPASIPRRFIVNIPNPTSILFDIEKASQTSQGFTPGSAVTGEQLNSERVWFDKTNPQYGEGPKL